MGPPPANRAMAIVQTAVYEAVNAITRRYPAGTLKLEAAPGASVDAAVAAASRTALAKLLPSQQGAIDAAYQAALAKVADGPAKTAGIALGEQAAAAMLAARADDGAAAAEAYRPHDCGGRLRADDDPGGHALAAAQALADERPAQFRPGPPPALTSALWARDYNEIKAVGGKSSARRTAEQSQIAELLGSDLAADLQRHRALGRRGSRSRGDAERAAFRRGGAGRRRCAARRLRRQVPLQLLAAR